MNGGGLQLSVGVKVEGTLPAPGNTPTNTIPDTTKKVTGGATQTLAYGTGTGRADAYCASEFVIPASGALTFDLYGGVDLLDMYGDEAPMRVLRSLAVVIASGTGDESGVRCGAAPTNEFVGWFKAAGHAEDIFPGGPPFAQGSPAGKSVTSAAKNFRIENLSALVSVRVRVYAAGSKITSGMSMGTCGGVYP